MGGAIWGSRGEVGCVSSVTDCSARIAYSLEVELRLCTATFSVRVGTQATLLT